LWTHLKTSLLVKCLHYHRLVIKHSHWEIKLRIHNSTNFFDIRFQIFYSMYWKFWTFWINTASHWRHLIYNCKLCNYFPYSFYLLGAHASFLYTVQSELQQVFLLESLHTFASKVGDWKLYVNSSVFYWMDLSFLFSGELSQTVQPMSYSTSSQ
jgi:hypothetical protein